MKDQHLKILSRISLQLKQRQMFTLVFATKRRCEHKIINSGFSFSAFEAGGIIQISRLIKTKRIKGIF